MITLPVGRALQALEALQKMGETKFPAKEAYHFGRLLKRLQTNPDILAANQSRIDSAKKFGVEKDGQIAIPPERINEFAAEYEQVAAIPVELDVPVLPVSILDHAPPMLPSEMMALEQFFEVV
jgi:hypothetical protein